MSAKKYIVYSPISKCCLHSLHMTLFEWLGWYLWHKMAFKISQDIFPWLENKMVENNNKNAHHSIQSKRLPCSQSTGVSSWSLLSSVDLFSAAYGSNWYGCRPYCLLEFCGSVLSSSKSLLSQDKCRWSSSLAMFQLIHKWCNKPGNPKSNRKLHLSWLQVKISIFHGQYWEN